MGGAAERRRGPALASRLTAAALALGVVWWTAPPTAVAAQASVRNAGPTPTMPSTLRYGSGLIDIPVSSVLPHLQITGTVSGFFAQIPRRVVIDDAGAPSGFGPERDEFYSDGSVALGLFDRAELGLSVQSLGDDADGGDVWGVFGRVRLWEPVDQGLGFAVGGRYLSSPSFADGGSYAPGRLGIPDERLRTRYDGLRGIDTRLSLYAVTTAYLRGFDGGPLPKNDMSFSVGYGGGMFSEGGELDFYSSGHANGWFFGGALHLGVADRSQLTLMAEHNGFDINVGAQFDWAGMRIGAQYLASNHEWPTDGHFSEYQKPKIGILASISICPGARGLRCTPQMMRRTEPDTVFIPPPAPDTVVIIEDTIPTPAVEGAVDASICLSTGQNVPIQVTPAGDTLVGPEGTSLRSLPGLEFSGAYAGTAFWYLDDRVIIFEGADFRKSDDVFPIDCGQILRVGVYQGVPVFAVLNAQRPLEVIFIPVRPGVWQRYERGMRPE